MEKKKRKKIFELYTKNETIVNVLEAFKNNQKSYLRMLGLLQLLGNFDGKTEVDFYEENNKDDKKNIKIWFSDLEGNIFILTPYSTSRAELTIVEKLTNDNHFKYDLALAKKFNLTSDNVELTQTEFVSTFKFGRLITDNKSFYNLFLSDNVCYQIQINSNSNDDNIDSKELLIELNKLENIPKFMEYIEIFDSLLQKSNINYSLISLRAYKNFEKIGSLSINGNKPKVEKVPTLKKSKI